MSSDQQQRASRAGRSVHGTYINMTPLDQITDTSNPAEEEYLKIAQAQERLAEIRGFIKSRGYTVFDICLSELQSSENSTRRESQGWLKNNAPELIHAACLSSLQFERTKSTICELASSIFVDDIK